MAGFQFRGTYDQAEASGKLQRFTVDAAHSTRIGPGDLIIITGDSDTEGNPEADKQTATTTRSSGVCMGIVPNFSGEALSQTYLPASTGGAILVNTDPDATYEVEVENGPLDPGDVGLNAPVVVTEGTLSGGLFISEMKVNKTGAATTATLPVRIEALREDSAGVLGNKALVKLNATTRRAGAAGV